MKKKQQQKKPQNKTKQKDILKRDILVSGCWKISLSTSTLLNMLFHVFESGALQSEQAAVRAVRGSS